VDEEEPDFPFDEGERMAAVLDVVFARVNERVTRPVAGSSTTARRPCASPTAASCPPGETTSTTGRVSSTAAGSTRPPASAVPRATSTRWRRPSRSRRSQVWGERATGASAITFAGAETRLCVKCRPLAR
jgi:hypothetical protein